MKQRFQKILIIWILLISVFFSVVYAHSGRTDSNGGHYVGGTSEYHYHHGYPAHDHIDGVCPYRLNENVTKKNNISDSIISDKDDNKNNDKVIKSNIEVNNKKNNEKSTFNTIIGIFFLSIFVIIPLFGEIYYSIRDKYFDRKKESIENSEVKIIPKENCDVNKINNVNEKNEYICPRCSGKLIIKNGRYGKFIGCSNYPRCKYTKSLKKK